MSPPPRGAITFLETFNLCSRWGLLLYREDAALVFPIFLAWLRGTLDHCLLSHFCTHQKAVPNVSCLSSDGQFPTPMCICGIICIPLFLLQSQLPLLFVAVSPRIRKPGMSCGKNVGRQELSQSTEQGLLPLVAGCHSHTELSIYHSLFHCMLQSWQPTEEG